MWSKAVKAGGWELASLVIHEGVNAEVKVYHCVTLSLLFL